MSIHAQIKTAAVDALKARDQKKRTALSFILSELNRVAKDELLPELSDDRSLSLLRKQLKQRKETLDSAQKANREDLASEARYEMGLIESYLPAEVSDDELKLIATKIISENGFYSPKDMGKVMAQFAKENPNADKSKIAGMVRELLSK